MKKPKFYYHSDLKRMGWTKTMIGTLLPQPKLMPNPYGYASKVKTWGKDEVHTAMQSQEFIEASKKAEERKKSVHDTINKKVAALCEKAALLGNTAIIPIVEDGELRGNRKELCPLYLRYSLRGR